MGKYSLPGGAAPSTEVHLTPPQRKNYTHPKLHSTPRRHKKQDTQAELLPHLRSGLLKSRDALQRMVTTSPPAEGSTNAPTHNLSDTSTRTPAWRWSTPRTQGQAARHHPRATKAPSRSGSQPPRQTAQETYPKGTHIPT